MSVEDFLKKNISIENIKGTNIIEIQYKHKSPDIVYGVVKNIINNYKIIYEQLNTNKASKDTKFIEKEYLSAKTELNNKINRLKASGTAFSLKRLLIPAI